MGFPNKLRLNQAILAATTLSGVAGTVVNGNKLSLAQVQAGSVVMAEVAVHIETASLTVTPSWQVTHDGTNFKDIAGGPNNAANVAITASKTVEVPFYGLAPGLFLRLIGTTAAATATANDTIAIKYHYVDKNE